MMSGSGKGRSAVASPSSVCSRHTKPGAPSPRALMWSSSLTNPNDLRIVERCEHAGDVQLREMSHACCLLPTALVATRYGSPE